jgi:hypothetical protein
MRISDLTASAAHRWVSAWAAGDLEAVHALLAKNARIEHNLGGDADRSALLAHLRELAAALSRVPVLSMTTTGRRAAILYDCQLREHPESIRLAEFLDIDDEHIVEIRRVYDLTAVDRFLPQLRGNS